MNHETNIDEKLKLFGERLKILRGETRLQDVADAIGISRASLGYYENGDRKPDIEILIKLASYYQVSCDYLLGFTNLVSPNIQERIMCEKTGLSEDVLNKILTRENCFLNILISSDDFSMMDYLFDEINFQYGLAEKKAHRYIELEQEYEKYTYDTEKQQEINHQFTTCEDLITRSEEKCDSASYKISIKFINILEQYRNSKISEIQSILKIKAPDTN